MELPKIGVCKLCLTEKFWLLKYFNNKHLLNKKSEFISNCRHKNHLLVKSVEKGWFYLLFYCFIDLVFVTKYLIVLCKYYLRDSKPNSWYSAPWEVHLMAKDALY